MNTNELDRIFALELAAAEHAEWAALEQRQGNKAKSKALWNSATLMYKLAEQIRQSLN